MQNIAYRNSGTQIQVTVQILSCVACHITLQGVSHGESRFMGYRRSLCRITVHLHDVSSQEEYGVSFQEVYDESCIASYERLLYETL